MSVSMDFKRNARGYYEYNLHSDNALDKQERKELMALATELDKVIHEEILRIKSIGEQNKKDKKAAKKKVTA